MYTSLGKLSKLKSGETWEKFKIGGVGGAFRNLKQSQVPEGTKDSKNDDSFSSYEDTKT